MKPERLLKRWEKSLAEWQDALRQEWRWCRRTGEVESIHRLRVLLRRLRVALRLGNRLLGRERVAAFRRWSVRMSDAVGPVRDVDVTLEWLQQQPEAKPVMELLRARRAQGWRAARRKLTRLLPVPAPSRRATTADRAPKKLTRRFERTLDEDRREIQQFNTPLDTGDVEHWHELRRDLRRIRYLREMALPRKEQKRDALLQKLFALQELLGNAQNCVAAQQVLQPCKNAPQAAVLLARLERQRREWLAKAQKALRAFQRSRVLEKF